MPVNDTSETGGNEMFSNVSHGVDDCSGSVVNNYPTVGIREG